MNRVRSQSLHRRISLGVLLALLSSTLPMQLIEPASGAVVSSLAIVVTPLSSGTAPFDPPASCGVSLQVGRFDVVPRSANFTRTSHCPGMDHSGDPKLDRIVRTGDTINVRINWALERVPSRSYMINGVNADPNVVVRSTLPLGIDGQPAAVWLAVPAGCYTASAGTPVIAPLSSVTNGGRTLTCNVGPRVAGALGSLRATIQISGYASDGQRIDVVAAISSATTRAAGFVDRLSAPQTFWSSASQRLNLKVDGGAMQQKFPAYGRSRRVGRVVAVTVAIPVTKGLAALASSSWSGVGTAPTGHPLSFDIDLSQFGSVPAHDGSPGSLASRAELYDWGRSGNGCGSSGARSNVSNGAVTPNDWSFTTSGADRATAAVQCSQAGGAGNSVHVDVFGIDYSLRQRRTVWAGWIAIWLPNDAIPKTPTSLIASVTNFDQASPARGTVRGTERSMSVRRLPTTQETQYGFVTQQSASSVSKSMMLSDQDVRTGATTGTLFGETAGGTSALNYGHGDSDSYLQVIPGATYLDSVSLGNNGSTSNNAPSLCNKWDNRTQQLVDFGDTNRPTGALQGNIPFAANTYSVVNTSGVTPNVWHPKSTWNRTAPFNSGTPHDIGADPAWYVVEFGVGEFDPYTPPPTSPAELAMRNTACRDQDSPIGWFTDPNDPAIQTWIDATYGAGSGIRPLDVVNKVRASLLGPLTPDSYVDLTIRLVARSTYGPTATNGLAATAIPFGTPLGTNAAFTDSNLATKSGSGYLNGWSVGNYDPGTDGGADGDRLTLAGVDTRARVYSLWSSPTALNGTSTVIAGQDVWWRGDYTSFALTASLPTSPPPTAMPLRAVTVVPNGLTYVPGSGCRVAAAYIPTSCGAAISPAAIVANNDGTTTLVWDLGSIVPTNAGVVTSITFRTQTNALTASGTLAVMQTLSESMNSDSTSNDTMPACTSLAARTNRSVPATANGPAESLAIPTIQCDTNAFNYRLARQPITINNSLTLAVSGAVGSQTIEPGEDDNGTGTRVAYTVTLKNFDTNVVPDSDVVMVLPYASDNRTPPSVFGGSISLQGVSTSATLSNTPNGLPTSNGPASGLSGTTFYYTSRSASAIANDPADPTNLLGGATKWCLATEFVNTNLCPASMAGVTAVRVISDTLANGGATRSFTLRFDTAGNSAGDSYTMRATERSSTAALTATATDVSMVVVDSRIGDTLWDDTNGDGIINPSETGRLSGVRVDLLNAGATVIATTLTDSLGNYVFTSLSSGSYTVRVVAANGSDGLADRYPAYSPSYDFDNHTVGGSDGNPDGIAAVSLGVGQPRLDVDFGYFAASLSGTAWNDMNANNVVDHNEIGVANVPVTLTGTDDHGQQVSRSGVSLADGSYQFVGLRAGTYAIAVGAGAGAVVPIAGTAGGVVAARTVTGIVLTTGARATSYNLSLRGPAVSGSIYTDVDGNGTRSAGDIGISGVGVTATAPTGVGGTTSGAGTTDATGNFNI